MLIEIYFNMINSFVLERKSRSILTHSIGTRSDNDCKALGRNFHSFILP
jgi:hypothetical protein